MSKKSDAARANIINAARTVLSQIGVASMTLQAVADAASISKGALYYYYKTKDEILYAIMEQDNAHSREIAEKLIQSENTADADDLKKEVIKEIIERFGNHDKNKLNLYLQGEALQGNTELQNKYNEKYHEWINNIDRILSRIYNADSSDITRTFSAIALAAIEGLCIQEALMNKIENNEKLIEKIIITLMNLDYKKTEKLLEKAPI